MSAAKLVIPIELWPVKPGAEAHEPVAGPQPLLAEVPRVPALRVASLLCPAQPRRFVRVPTHAVGIHPEQREYPRATLNLPLRLRAADGKPEEHPVTLVTRNISSTRYSQHQLHRRLFSMPPATVNWCLDRTRNRSGQ